MKRFFKYPVPALLVAALLFVAAVQAQGLDEVGTQPMDVRDVDGTVWLDSDRDAKLNFLLGVENAIAMECAITEARAKRDGVQAVYSPFQRGWIDTFKDTPRFVLANRIDQYYERNPAFRNRHVFEVIWNEMIVPTGGNS